MRPSLLARFVPAFTILLASHACAADAGFSLKEKPGEALDIVRDGKVLARYMMAHDVSTPERRTETYKPFLHVFDDAGKEPITKGAGGSFTHHRGIFIGWNKLIVGGKTYDRWHMKDGEQVHESFSTRSAGADAASFTSQVRWQGEKSQGTVIEEERTFTFRPGPGAAYAMIDVHSKLKAVAGETALNGDPEHSGLHFRPADTIDKTKTSYLYPVENAQPKKDRDYPWFGESFTIPSGRFSVVYLSHPGNPKDAATSAYRDYGRFGTFWKTTIPANETAEFRARFLVFAGELPEADFIQKQWNEYAGKNEPTPKFTARAAEKSKPAAPKKPGAAKPVASAAPDAAEIKITLAAKAPEAAKPTDAKDAEAKPMVLSDDPAIRAAQSTKRAGGGPENPELHFRPPAPPVLTPEQQMKTFKVAPGFKVQLVAAEPMVESPVSVSWDDQGRMYVCEMRSYMHDVDGAGEDQPIGRITRLEDTDGDGVMDQRTVFVDKLVMPRAVMALGDGAVVSEPPLLTWYRDTDGDGVSDKKEIISEKYATKDGQPEHMANSITWTMDNWMTSSNHNVRYRFKGGQFESQDTTASGQWGRTQDDWGRQYYNTNSDLLRTDLFAPAYYVRNPRLPDRTGIGYQVMRDQTCWPAYPTPGVNRGYLENTTKPDGTLVKGTLRPDGTLQNVTATCGAAIYRGHLFPAEYRGNAFIPEPSGNLVKRLVLTDKDGVVNAANAYEGKEFLTSTDERFRPVNAYTGPDGALYLVDMARGVIQHKGFLTYYLVANIKDRNLELPIHLGRIYRVVPEKGPQPKLVKLPTETAKIPALLAHANGVIRDAAQRVLVEKGDASVVPAVQKIAATGKTPQTRVQALWTLSGLNAVTPEVLASAFKDKSDKVRSAAVQVADESATPELAKLVADPSEEVRLQLAFKLGGQQSPEVEKALISLLENTKSALAAEAVVSGLAGKELEFLEALLAHTANDDTKLASSGIFGTLAGAIIKERNGPRVGRLIELTATQAPGSRQLALLNGMVGKALGKAPAKGQPAPNLIKLEGEPKGFAELLKSERTKSFAAKIERQITWPGKPGAVEVKVVPLTPAEQVLFTKGKAIYAGLCGACHQPSGAGMPGLAPPLLNSEWALGPAERMIRIVIGGLTGPIEVAGTKWQLEMPALPILTDEDLAATLTYIRREWEHTASAVAPSEVAAVRAATKGRTKPWTAAELDQPLNIQTVKAK